MLMNVPLHLRIAFGVYWNEFPVRGKSVCTTLINNGCEIPYLAAISSPPNI